MDFVDFNLAKKLKEKVFDVPCIYAYCKKGGWNKYTQEHEPITYVLRTDGNPFGSYYIGENWNKEYKTNKNKIQCSAPTISQVLKWLREEKKVEIVASFDYEDKTWGYQVGDMTLTEDSILAYRWNFPTYEQAVLSGIEYTIDNLI